MSDSIGDKFQFGNLILNLASTKNLWPKNHFSKHMPS